MGTVNQSNCNCFELGRLMYASNRSTCNFSEYAHLMVVANWSNCTCTALVVGSDDVASSFCIGVFMERLAGRREGSRGARVVASY